MKDNIISILKKRQEETPEQIAYCFLTENQQEKTISYAQLWREVTRLAAGVKQTTQSNDRVVILFEPGLDYVITFLACCYAGVIAVPAYPPLNHSSYKRLKALIKNSDPSLVITSEKIKKWFSLCHGLSFIRPALVRRKLLQYFRQPFLADYHALRFNCWLTNKQLTKSGVNNTPRELSDIAFIQYTSGSTGKPKGVVLRHDNILDNLAFIVKQFNVTSKDKALIWLPPYHDMGLIGGILTPLYIGMPVYLLSPFDFIKNPLCWLELISRYKATVSGGPNFAYELCCEKITHAQTKNLNLSSWKVAFCGAEPINYQTLERFKEKFSSVGFSDKSFSPCYGLAEATLMVTGRSHDVFSVVCLERKALSEDNIKLDTSNKGVFFVGNGRVHNNVMIADNQHKPLGEKKLGVICIKGKNVMTSYWARNNINEKDFFSNKNSTYFKTGDLGFIYKNELYVTGRVKDLLIFHGKNYYPHDIEKYVTEQFNAIKPGRCVAYSLNVSGKEQLTLVIELRNQALANKQLTEQLVTAIAYYFSIPLYKTCIVPAGAIPKTSSGKLQRSLTRSLIESNKITCILCELTNKSKANFNHRETEPSSIEVNTLVKKLQTTTSEKVKRKLLTPYLITLVKSHTPINITINERTHFANIGFDSLLFSQVLSEVTAQLRLKEAPILEAKFSQLTVKKLAQHLAKQTFSLISQPSTRLTLDKEHFPAIKQFEKVYQCIKQTKGEILFLQTFFGKPGSQIELAGKKHLNFASYNYLGLACNELVINNTKKAIDDYGTSVSASRIVAGDRVITRELEKKIAGLLACEDSLVFTAGYHTVISTITHLFSSGDLIVYDQFAHNSTTVAAKFSGATFMPFKHNDPQSLDSLLSDIRHQYNKVLLVVEGIYSMDGDISPMNEYQALKEKYNFLIMVDEAHSVGVLGDIGGGVKDYFSLSNDVIDIYMGTLSKSLASCGGYIAANEAFIYYLKATTPGFVFSAGITPQNTAAALSALNVMASHPELLQKLHDNSVYFLTQLKALGLNTGTSENTPIIPIILHDSKKTLQFSNALFAKGIYAPAIIYPAVPETDSRLRFFISTLHSHQQLTQTIEVIRETLDELSI